MTKTWPGGEFELVEIPSGGFSIRSLENGETFHPGIGPMAEARLLHAAQHDLPPRAAALIGESPFVIWDVGLGAAANAVAVLETEFSGPVELHSFDCTLQPLRFAMSRASELRYPEPWLDLLEELCANGAVQVGPLEWRLHLGDFSETLHSAPPPDAVLFDPYSPAANPGMWTRELFAAIRSRAGEGRVCTLSSYSRSTVTRVNLLNAGWFVGRGFASGEKTETTVAATDLRLLREPLRVEWLDRVRRSKAAALGDASSVAAELSIHPQFN